MTDNINGENIMFHLIEETEGIYLITQKQVNPSVIVRSFNDLADAIAFCINQQISKVTIDLE
jgi:hypothetical protein